MAGSQSVSQSNCTEIFKHDTKQVHDFVVIQVVPIWYRVLVPGTVLDQYLVRFDVFNDPLMHFIQRIIC